MSRAETAKQAASRLARPMLDKGFRPEALHAYRAADGGPIYFRIRVRHPDTGEKWIRPMHLNGQGYQLGEPKFDGLKPLYNLHRLAKASPDALVVIVEGEKAVDALTGIGVLATTSGGADSAEKADWSHCKGHPCLIWRDRDEAGENYAAAVEMILRGFGCRVESIDVDALDLPPKGDAADWVSKTAGANWAAVMQLPRAGQSERAGPEAATAEINEPPAKPRGDTRPPAISPNPRPILRRFSDIESKPIRWLWPGRIARGKVTMLAGHPGLGKSQVTASLAAIVTRGGTWPVDRTQCELGSVVFLSAEDDAEDTIRPRLEAAGADLSRCLILDAVSDGFTSSGTEIRRSFNLRTDLARLAEALALLGDVAMVVIDPISAYLGGADSHNNAEIRALLAPLSELAASHAAAVVGVSHLNKGGNNEALLRVTGSLAFVAAARAAFIVTSDKENPERRLFLPLKNNLGRDREGLAFSIQSATVPNPTGAIESSKVVWEGQAVTITADEAMAPALGAEERSDLEDATAFLSSLLSNGPVASKRVRAESEGCGHSWATIRRAQKVLGVEAIKEGMNGPWVWSLPPKMLKNPEDAQPQSVSTFGEIEHLRGPADEAEVFK